MILIEETFPNKLAVYSDSQTTIKFRIVQQNRLFFKNQHYFSIFNSIAYVIFNNPYDLLIIKSLLLQLDWKFRQVLTHLITTKHLNFLHLRHCPLSRHDSGIEARINDFFKSRDSKKKAFLNITNNSFLYLQLTARKLRTFKLVLEIYFVLLVH